MVMNLSLPEQLAHSTVRIECILPKGELATGTGFFYSLNRSDDTYVPVIITNKHVVDEATKARFVMTLKDATDNPSTGKVHKFELDNFSTYWKPHPDPSVDLCAMPIAPLLCAAQQKKVELFFIPLERSFIPSVEDIADMLGSEEVTIVGYPNGLWDEVNNLPIFRRGIVATNFRADWNGHKEFLIDAACFPGSSGSPVFLLDMYGYKTREGTFLNQSRLKLLGVLYAMYQQTVEGEIQKIKVPTRLKRISVTEIPINLGVVIKAERLLDFEDMFSK